MRFVMRSMEEEAIHAVIEALGIVTNENTVLDYSAMWGGATLRPADGSYVVTLGITHEMAEDIPDVLDSIPTVLQDWITGLTEDHPTEVDEFGDPIQVEVPWPIYPCSEPEKDIDGNLTGGTVTWEQGANIIL